MCIISFMEVIIILIVTDRGSTGVLLQCVLPPGSTGE